ncbi:MAG: ATP-binding protein [Flammeovirgaceae bacterium]|nr:ATP-binding protein [Flammeovirgaceae bacterium]
MDLSLINSLPCLAKELQWLEEVITFRLSEYFKQEESLHYPEIPDISRDDSYYAQLARKNEFNEIDRMVIIIALAPHLQPSIFDIFFTKNKQYDRFYAEFGGVKGDKHNGFLPTGETAAFIIAGADLGRRFQLYKCFEEDHVFYKENVLSIGFTNEHEPIWSGELIISKEFLSYVTLNEPYKPRFSPSFPAQLLTTRLEWDDAIFDPRVYKDISHIQTWMNKEKQIMHHSDMKKYLKKGYRALFYGPPGTGKSMTAALLGKSEKLDVYRVDLSSVVSKFIGETEKNLANIFKIAENKGWILFFDEADALFSKRTSTQSSNDMHANQQVSYLLQRIEDFDGVAILASNFKDNIDDAFLRRFQSIVYFPKPDQYIRVKLWEKYFASYELENIDFDKISTDYEISGGSILNVLRYCAVEAIKRKNNQIIQKDIIEAIKKEYLKEGQTI